MNVRELNDEQAEQLGKTLEAWTAHLDDCAASDGNRMIDGAKLEHAMASHRKLQEMLQPPKQYLVQWVDDAFSLNLYSLADMQTNSNFITKACIYEWQDGVGTVGAPITGEALKELLEGDSK